MLCQNKLTCLSPIHYFEDSMKKFIALRKFTDWHCQVRVELPSLCHATGGMIGKFPTLLPSMNEETREEVYAEFMESAKRSEIEFGFNAFLVYDPVDDNPGFEMSRWATDLLGRCKPKDERYFPDAVDPPLPKSPTTSQLEYNCEVLVMYCLNWVYRQTGSYVLKGLVEDSATAEIARAKLLDWSRRSLSLLDVDGRPSICTHDLIMTSIRNQIHCQWREMICSMDTTDDIVFDHRCVIQKDDDEIHKSWFQNRIPLTVVPSLMDQLINELLDTMCLPYMVTDYIQAYLYKHSDVQKIIRLDSE
eukprot:GHVH01002729.1.p1 GENE.GHVH01002729.1~~GHVH01002729.1.p1  ORF type:complete len:304 (+),score=44.60 GHVH01002729.1:1114-2025(+)